MRDQEKYAAQSAKELNKYDACKKGDFEARGEQLPCTELGSKARARAMQEGRLLTNKQAREAGLAPLTAGEQKTKDHIASLIASAKK